MVWLYKLFELRWAWLLVNFDESGTLLQLLVYCWQSLFVDDDEVEGSREVPDEIPLGPNINSLALKWQLLAKVSPLDASDRRLGVIPSSGIGIDGREGAYYVGNRPVCGGEIRFMHTSAGSVSVAQLTKLIRGV